MDPFFYYRICVVLKCQIYIQILIGFSIRSVFHGLDLDLGFFWTVRSRSVFSGQLDTIPCFWTLISGWIGSVSGSFFSTGSDPVFLDDRIQNCFTWKVESGFFFFWGLDTDPGFFSAGPDPNPGHLDPQPPWWKQVFMPGAWVLLDIKS